MQHLKVSGAVRPLKWSLGFKWLIILTNESWRHVLQWQIITISPHEANFPNFVLVRITKIPSKKFLPHNETKTSNRYLLMTMPLTSVQ